MKRSFGVVFMLAMGIVSAGCDMAGEELGESEAEVEIAAASAVLTCRTETAPQNQVNVFSSDGTPIRNCIGTNNPFAYLTGSQLTLQVVDPQDEANCLLFSRWTGPCAGQRNPCRFIINEDVTVEAVWEVWRGCEPR